METSKKINAHKAPKNYESLQATYISCVPSNSKRSGRTFSKI